MHSIRRNYTENYKTLKSVFQILNISYHTYRLWEYEIDSTYYIVNSVSKYNKYNTLSESYERLISVGDLITDL